MLIKFPESWFTTNPDLSDIDYICRHTRAFISIDKDFGFFSRPYRLDIFSSLIPAFGFIDKITRYYSRPSRKQADVFYIACIEQEIAWLNIIVL